MYQSYSLATTQPRERFDYFHGIVDGVFCRMTLDIDRGVRAAFEASLESTDLGRVQLVRVSTSPLQVRRLPQDIARIDDPPYLVKFQRAGESLWSQRGRDVHVRRGDFVVCSTAEPYALRFRGPYDMPVLVVPQSIMRRVTPDPDQFLGVRMAGDDADCGLLSSFVFQVAARMNRLAAPMMRRVEANILDLLGAVLNARARPGSTSRAGQLARIKVYIGEHLHERQLGPGTIAAALRLSTRYVHSVFEGEDTTVGGYIRRCRLAACRESLESAGPSFSLTDIALRWGFYDLSHMTRCFNREYGAPPRRFLLQLRDGEACSPASSSYKGDARSD
jgi:AraC family transcriptional regulator, positive regulator of tynA and feaB